MRSGLGSPRQGGRDFSRAAGAQQLCSTRPHEPPRASRPALVECPATRGFVVEVMVGIPGWHARVRGSNPLSSTTTTPQVTGLPFLQRRFLPLPDCPIRATRVPLGAGGGVSGRAAAASTSSSNAAALAASRPAIACCSATRQPRRNAPSDQTAPVPPDLNFPPAQQVVVVQRHTTDLTGSNARTELVYALSSQPAHHASPQQLGTLARAHWQVEALHWVRDVTFAEDASRIRTASGPPGHGHPAQPRDRAAPTGRSHPGRPHAALGQPESHPRPGVPRPPMNPLTPQTRSPRGPMAETCRPVRGSR
jgi:hypothetical protein